MSRFFFNVHDGEEDMFDEKGAELKTTKAMRFHLMTMATEMLLDEKPREEGWQMEVLDESGEIVASMNFGAESLLARRR